MEPTQELIETLHADKVRLARSLPPDMRWSDPLENFETQMAWVEEAIRAQMPGASEEAVRRELSRRTRINRAVEDQPMHAAFLPRSLRST